MLVPVMAADNEPGALQPIADLARITREHGALFHCDAAQAAGKILLDVSGPGVDLLTVAGHKMYAPRASPPSTYVPAWRLNRSSTAAARRTACAPAPRTSPSPSPIALRGGKPPVATGHGHEHRHKHGQGLRHGAVPDGAGTAQPSVPPRRDGRTQE
ncbi:aminotransferase class V-fold PLP-dependent enzyme [Streptomyces halobius]|uniref:aminotransferase class V-fold PLP-dependent enzyme n=1 Tax=Streptomyces halobius TaxID=2879846 RepID=UPI00200F82E7|nr:aminotransferase class V-fold PLP-dependent enzyme [Streptomyces halobius]